MFTLLTWEKFLMDCNELVEISSKIDLDKWSLVGKDCNEGNSYLACSKKVRVTDDILSMQYNIVYSISYQVPVLYFNGHKSNGAALTLEDVWRVFGKSISQENNLLQSITQGDHPLTFKPYFFLHPCRTAEVLANAPHSYNYVVTFLSSSGPFVGLDLNNEIGMYFSSKEKSAIL